MKYKKKDTLQCADYELLLLQLTYLPTSLLKEGSQEKGALTLVPTCWVHLHDDLHVADNNSRSLI
jgi:hypothetical protein